MASVTVRLRVKGDVDCGAGMFVVGDCLELGNWWAHGAIQLQQQPRPIQIEDSVDGIWEAWVDLPQNTDVYFRYFQGKVIPNKSQISVVGSTNLTDGSKRVVEVWKWETNIHPRHIRTSDADVFEPPLAMFGFYDESHTVSFGWLENHACVQVRFHSNPLYIWKQKHRLQLYSIKCSPLDYEPGLDQSESIGGFYLDESLDGPSVCDRTALVYYNLSDEHPNPGAQPPTGCVYKKDDYLVFIARGYNQIYLGFQVDFFVHSKDSEPQFIGTAHLLPPYDNPSFHSKRIPIIGLNHRPIGEVQVETLRITPMAGYDWKMDISYQNHWKWRKSDNPLNVGHRGMGSSYKKY